MREKEAGEQLLHKINSDKRLRSAFELFLVEQLDWCPFCFKDLQVMRTNDGPIRVCVNCGFEPDSTHNSKDIPFGETKCPPNEMAFNRAMGGTLGDKGMFRVLADGRNGVKDLPIRALHIKTISEHFEPPKIRTMLRLGRMRSHQWGFDNHKDFQSIIFSNYFAKMLKHTGKLLVEDRTNFPITKVVDACFVLCLKEIRGGKAFEDAVEQLKVDSAILEKVLTLSEVYRRKR
jgi:hypothetical protein